MCKNGKFVFWHNCFFAQICLLTILSLLNFLSCLHRQTVAGKMLRLLRQWHRPQKDPGAFIQILPIEYVHLHILIYNKTWTDRDIHSINWRNSPSHTLESYCESPSKKKINNNISSDDTIGHLRYKQKVSLITIQQSMETFVQISHYIQRAGVSYSLVMFPLCKMR